MYIEKIISNKTHYYKKVDFYVPVDMKYIDPTDDLYIDFKQGMQHLDGEDALKVVRFRKNNAGVGYSDLGRAETQRNLLMAVAKKVLSLGSMRIQTCLYRTWCGLPPRRCSWTRKMA